MEEPESHKTAKIVLLGASDVGKSSVVLRFVQDKFTFQRESTIGAAFLAKVIPIDDYLLRLEIWDTAGQERYHSLAPMYYRDAMGALVVYDVTDRKSFERAKEWLQELYKGASNTIVIALVGNKCDLENIAVSTDEGRKYAEEQKLMFLETSAKTNRNIAEAFTMIGKRIIETAPPTEANDSFNVNQSTHTNDDGDCKC